MIIQRTHKYALHFYFDLEDAQKFIALLNQAKLEIPVKYFKYPQTPQSKLLCWVMDDDERIEIQNNRVVLQIDDETHQYMLYLFSEFMVTGDFSVSECCALAIGTWKEKIQIYCLKMADFPKNSMDDSEI